MFKAICLSKITLLILAIMAFPTRADVPEGRAEHLLPLEDGAIDVNYDPGRLTAMADLVNQRVAESNAPAEDPLSELPLIGDLIEQFTDGDEVALPLGITVFESVDDMAVGIDLGDIR